MVYRWFVSISFRNLITVASRKMDLKLSNQLIFFNNLVIHMGQKIKHSPYTMVHLKLIIHINTSFIINN